jgi:hypothetical protein
MGDVHDGYPKLVGQRVPGRGHVGLGSVVLEENRREVISRTSAEILGAQLDLLEPLE